MLGPTITPAPTSTPAATPTPAFTPTPDPLQVALESANTRKDIGDYEGALAVYSQMLQQFPAGDPGREDVYRAIVEFADGCYQQALNAKGKPDVCQVYENAYAAFEIVLKSQDGPDIPRRYQIHAAETAVALLECRYTYNVTFEGHNTVIDSLAADLEYYDAPDAREVLLSKIMYAHASMFNQVFADECQAAIDKGHSLIESVGGYELKGQKVADIISKRVVSNEICSGIPPTIPIVGISEPKKVFPCPGVSTGINAFFSSNLDETWYALKYEAARGSDLQCHGTNHTTGKSFSYSYPGTITETYSLLDVHTGKVLASKTFRGTPPLCIFTSCTLSGDTASCTGGAGASTYDLDEMFHWLETLLQ